MSALCEVSVPDDLYGTQPCEASAAGTARYNDDGDPDVTGRIVAPICDAHLLEWRREVLESFRPDSSDPTSPDASPEEDA